MVLELYNGSAILTPTVPAIMEEKEEVIIKENAAGDHVQVIAELMRTNYVLLSVITVGILGAFVVGLFYGYWCCHKCWIKRALQKENMWQITTHKMIVNSIDKSKDEKQSMVTLDEAMILAGFGIYNILHMLMSGIILMGMIMQSLAMGYILPAAQCDLDLTLQQRGWLSAIPFAAIIVTSYFWGWLADTRGRKPIIQFSMFMSTIFSVLASFAPEIISFAVLQFISAVFMSGTSAAAYTYLGEFNNLRHRDKMMAFGSSFIGWGTVILPCISWLILPLEFSFPINFLGIVYRPWRLLIIAFAMPFAIASVMLFFAPETPKFLAVKGDNEAALDVVKTIYSGNTRMPKDTFEVKALMVEYQTTASTDTGFKAVIASMKDQTLPLFKMPLLPWFVLCSFVQFGMFAATNGFYVWFPTILNSLANHEGGETRICDVLEASKVPIGNETEVFCDDTINTATFERSIYIGLVFSSMYFIVGFLVDIVGKKLILVTILSVTGLCGIGANLAYNQQLAVVLFAVFQMCGACIGLMNAVAVELFPTKHRAMAICLAMMMGRVGSMIGSNLVGLFLEINCGAGFYLFGGIIIVNAVCCLTLPNKKKAPPVEPKMVEPTQNQTHEPV